MQCDDQLLAMMIESDIDNVICLSVCDVVHCVK